MGKFVLPIKLSNIWITVLLAISLCGINVTTSYVAKELIDKYSNSSLIIEVNNVKLKTGPSDQINGYVLIKKCASKACNIATQYCDTAVDQCMSCANLCLPARTSDPSVKQACETHCAVFLQFESKKQKVAPTGFPPTTGIKTSAVQVEQQNGCTRNFDIVPIVLSAAVIILTIAVIVLVILLVRAKAHNQQQQQSFYGQNRNDLEQNLENGKGFYTATVDGEKGIKSMELTQPQQPDTEDTSPKKLLVNDVSIGPTANAAEFKRSHNPCSQVTSNEDQILPAETGTMMHSHTGQLLTNSSAGVSSTRQHPQSAMTVGDHMSTQPLLSTSSTRAYNDNEFA